MATANPTMALPSGNLTTVAKSITKLLRLHRTVNSAAVDEYISGDKVDDSISSLKLSTNLTDYFFKAPPSPPSPSSDLEKVQKQRRPDELVMANVFAAVASIKSAYAELQLAQSPYDPDAIRCADLAIIAVLRRISDLKHAYFMNEFADFAASPESLLIAQTEELRHLIKTYKITARNLDADLRRKEAELESMRSLLKESERECSALEARLHPGRSLAGLSELHLSGLNPTHFLVALRATIKSVRAFTKSLTKEMESVNWDVGAAAAAIHPGVKFRRPEHCRFAVESYVCLKMFSNFHCRDFSLSFLEEMRSWDPRRFFVEFSEMKQVRLKDILDDRRWSSGFGKFLRAKYLSVVHSKMEERFFGRLEQRALVSSGPGFPDSEWFTAFAEMTLRVWLLHCLLFSFDGVAENELADEVGCVFQARRGDRFSETYMDNIAGEEDSAAEGERPIVGFTVIPGFKIHRTLIQCRVYLSPP